MRAAPRRKSVTVQRRYPRVDACGRDLAQGDWVRVVAIPPDVDAAAPLETRAAFAGALGRTFRVEGFNRYGLAELDLTRKVAWGESIWVEPRFLRRTRRALSRTAVAQPERRTRPAP